jgi:hypothetical protein
MAPLQSSTSYTSRQRLSGLLVFCGSFLDGATAALRRVAGIRGGKELIGKQTPDDRNVVDSFERLGET